MNGWLIGLTLLVLIAVLAPFGYLRMLRGHARFAAQGPQRANAEEIERPEIVKRICCLPLDFKRGSKTLIQLIRESGYVDNPDALERERVEAFLRDKPDLQDAWVIYSGDKRVSAGWYFDADGDGWVVGYYPGKERQKFVSKLEACAEFVLREAFALKSGVEGHRP